MRREDLKRENEFQNDVEYELLHRYRPPMPTSLTRTEKEFDEWMAKPDTHSIDFAIEADGKYIGSCSLYTHGRFAGTAELAIGIGDRDYWGKGYGREVVSLLVDYGFRILNLHKISLTVMSNNERAIRSYRAAGFVEEGRLSRHAWSGGRYVDVVHMGIFRDGADGRTDR